MQSKAPAGKGRGVSLILAARISPCAALKRALLHAGPMGPGIFRPPGGPTKRISMKMKSLLMGTFAILLLDGAAQAQPYNNDNQRGANDPNGYYSQLDRNGYYDRNGRYQNMRRQD